MFSSDAMPFTETADLQSSAFLGTTTEAVSFGKQGHSWSYKQSEHIRCEERLQLGILL